MVNVRDLNNKDAAAIIRSIPTYAEGRGQQGNMPLSLPPNYLLVTTPASHNLPAMPTHGFWPVDLNSDGTITLAGAGNDNTVQKGNAIRYATGQDYPAANQVLIQFSGRYDIPAHGLSVANYYYLADVTAQVDTYQIATGSGSYDFSINGTTINQVWTTDDRTTMELIRDAANANATISAAVVVTYDLTNALLVVTERDPAGGFTLTGTGTNLAIAQTTAPGQLGQIASSSPALSQPLLYVWGPDVIEFDSQRITRLNLAQELLQVITLATGIAAGTPQTFELTQLQGINACTGTFCFDTVTNEPRAIGISVNLAVPSVTVSTDVTVTNRLQVTVKGVVTP